MVQCQKRWGLAEKALGHRLIASSHGSGYANAAPFWPDLVL